MSKPTLSSMCLTDILEYAKQKHSAFSKSEKNGKIYFSFLTWNNDEPDKFGNDVSHQLNAKKDSQDKKHYIGNGKFAKTQEQPINESDIPEPEDLPF